MFEDNSVRSKVRDQVEMKLRGEVSAQIGDLVWRDVRTGLTWALNSQIFWREVADEVLEKCFLPWFRF